MPIQRFGKPTKPGALPFSKAVTAGGWLYISGQVPRDAQGDIVAGNMTQQARITLTNVKNAVEMAGYSLEDVVRVTVFLDDPGISPSSTRSTVNFSPWNMPRPVCAYRRP